MLYSLDIETKCGIGCTEKCDHALDPYKNEITIIGLCWKEQEQFKYHTCNTVEELRQFLGIKSYALLGFNLKWDLHTIYVKGLDLTLHWREDVSLMAATYSHKIPENYLAWYESQRLIKNKDLKKGYSHRKAKGMSLKTLAPYFLEKEPFWENPEDHNNIEYVLKDAQYAYELYEFFLAELNKEDSYSFYKNKYLPWTKLLLDMEIKGVKIDLKEMEILEAKAKEDADIALKTIKTQWDHIYQDYKKQEEEGLIIEYGIKYENSLVKYKDSSQEKQISLFKKYQSLLEKAISKIEPFSIDSPKQLSWALKDKLGLDILNFDDEESTGKVVLERLANTGREDIKALLSYRKNKKLVTSFFPTYKDLHNDGVLHPSFNPTGARTGRLSCNNPNLQQVPSHLHKMFVPRPGYKFIIKDQSAIEPRLIAYLTEDKTLFDILDKGYDFHGYNTKIFFELKDEVNKIKVKYPKEREVGKEVGLAILYGAGAKRLQESAQKRGFIWSFKECKKKVERFRDSYPAVEAYREYINKELINNCIFNIFGRPIRIENIDDIYMKGFNSLIQGSASDMVLNSAYKAQEEYYKFDILANVILLVHDEIVVECPQDEVEFCEKVLETAMVDYQLKTRHGLIKLKTEGKISNYWEK